MKETYADMLRRMKTTSSPEGMAQLLDLAIAHIEKQDSIIGSKEIVIGNLHEAIMSDTVSN